MSYLYSLSGCLYTAPYFFDKIVSMAPSWAFSSANLASPKKQHHRLLLNSTDLFFFFFFCFLRFAASLILTLSRATGKSARTMCHHLIRPPAASLAICLGFSQLLYSMSKFPSAAILRRQFFFFFAFRPSLHLLASSSSFRSFLLFFSSSPVCR